MNTELNDKLDLIIAWAARDCENDEAEKFKKHRYLGSGAERRFLCPKKKADREI